jgi:Glycosyl transferase family 2
MAIEKPMVTVLTTVYNGELFLRESIESIVNQTFSHFELLIVNDGSTDKSKEIVKEFHDHRIRFVSLEKNIGICEVLNLGLELATGKYIAIMDQDDISCLDRLEKQVNYLENNPDISCVGTNFYWLNNSDEKSWIQYFESEDVKIASLFSSPICHPTVMYRLSDLRHHNLSYSLDYPYAEDYNLWVELVKHTKVMNLSEPLLHYRKHSGQISRLKSETQCKCISQIQIKQLNLLDLKPTQADLMLHNSLGGAFIPLPNLERFLYSWGQRLIEANGKKHIYVDDIFANQVYQRVANVIHTNDLRLHGMPIVRQLYWQTTSLWRYIRQRHGW